MKSYWSAAPFVKYNYNWLCGRAGKAWETRFQFA